MLTTEVPDVSARNRVGHCDARVTPINAGVIPLLLVFGRLATKAVKNPNPFSAVERWQIVRSLKGGIMSRVPITGLSPVVPPSMKAKFFVIVLVVLMLVGITIIRSWTVKKTLPISPSVFDEVQKDKTRE